MNQNCFRLLAQMVFKTYAEDPDLFDREPTRRQSRPRLDSQIHCRQILPAISVNKLRSGAGKMPANRNAWMRALEVRAPQKENQCQES